MSLENVRTHFTKLGIADKILEFEESSATVSEAANALGVQESQIAKTLSFRGKTEEEAILIVTAGDAKIDNKKFKNMFHLKARMLSPDEVYKQTGHHVGGVCPFGLTNNVPVYIDQSLQRFDYVYPACGSSNSAIQLTCEQLFTYANAVDWVDICKGWKD